MANNNPEWRDTWPEGPEAELFFKTVAHFYRQRIGDRLNIPIEGEENIDTSPDLGKRIEAAIEKVQRKTTRNKYKKVLRKVATIAAIFILCISSTPTVIFAVSPTFRETVYNFILDWRQGHVNISIGGQLPEGGFLPKYYMPTFIPDGFIISDHIDNMNMMILYYINGNQYFTFASYDKTTNFSVDTETASFNFEHKINGLPAIVRENRGEITISWQDNTAIFELSTNLSLDIAMEIASSYTLQEKNF